MEYFEEDNNQQSLLSKRTSNMQLDQKQTSFLRCENAFNDAIESGMDQYYLNHEEKLIIASRGSFPLPSIKSDRNAPNLALFTNSMEQD